MQPQSLSSIWDNYLSSGLLPSAATRRIQYINAFSALGVLILLSFSAFNIIGGNILLATVEIFGALCVIANIVVLRSTKNSDVASAFIVAVLLVLVVTLATTGGIEGTGIFWLYTFPLLVFFLRGPDALPWIGVFFVGLTVLFGLVHAGVILDPYSDIVMVEVLASLFGVTLLAYLYQRITAHADSLIELQRRELASTTLQLESIAERFPYGLLIEDENRKIVILNREVMRAFGSSDDPNLFVGMDNRRAITTLKPFLKDVDAYIKRVEEIVVAQQPVIDEGIPLLGDRYLSRTYMPLFSEKGTSRGGLWIFKDVTEEKNISDMKTNFISLVSHQLKTPVAQIKGFVANMQDGLTGPLTEKQCEYLGYLMEVAEKNGVLIDELLNVSRIERGIITFNAEKIEAGSLVKEALSPLRSVAAGKKVRIEEQVTTKGALISVDPVKTVEAIRNIIDNAIKFSPENGVVVVSVEKSGNNVCVSIEDHGQGIDPDVQKELFEKDRVWSGKVKAAGTGLGLFLSKKFVTLQGGTITFKTAPGKGTTFFVTFGTASV